MISFRLTYNSFGLKESKSYPWLSVCCLPRLNIETPTRSDMSFRRFKNRQALSMSWTHTWDKINPRCIQKSCPTSLIFYRGHPRISRKENVDIDESARHPSPLTLSRESDSKSRQSWKRSVNQCLEIDWKCKYEAWRRLDVCKPTCSFRDSVLHSPANLHTTLKRPKRYPCVFAGFSTLTLLQTRTNVTCLPLWSVARVVVAPGPHSGSNLWPTEEPQTSVYTLAGALPACSKIKRDCIEQDGNQALDSLLHFPLIETKHALWWNMSLDSRSFVAHPIKKGTKKLHGKRPLALFNSGRSARLPGLKPYGFRYAFASCVLMRKDGVESCSEH